MDVELTRDQLRRAADDLGRIERFLAQRVQWRATPGAESALIAADAAAARIAAALEPHLGDPCLPPAGGSGRTVDVLPRADLDHVPLEKMSHFLAQLGAWFAARASGQVELGAADLVEEAYRCLLAIRESIALILGGSSGVGERKGAAAPAQPAGDDPPLGGRRERIGPPPEARPHGPASRGERLVLEESEETPLLQTFKDQTELTPHARELVDGFLERGGIPYTGYQRTKFEAEVVHRLEIVPPGQVLVIKVGDYGGEPKPFFNYVPKQPQGQGS